MINNKDPNLESCEAPAWISNMWDVEPSTTVHCFLSERLDLYKASKQLYMRVIGLK